MIGARAVLPGPFDPDAFSREIIKEAERMNKRIKADFDKTVATWEHKPVFRMSVRVQQFEIIGEVHTAKIFGKSPELIYYFINQGTAVRYAKMTQDFEPKSRVRVIGSFPGAGGLDKVDVRFPMPGIKARRFNEEIANKHQVPLRLRMALAIRRGVQKSGHAFTR